LFLKQLRDDDELFKEFPAFREADDPSSCSQKLNTDAKCEVVGNIDVYSSRLLDRSSTPRPRIPGPS